MWILHAPRPVINTVTQLKPSHCPNCWSVFDCVWKSSLHPPMLWCFSWSGPRRTAERRNTNTLSALRNAQSLLLTHEVNKTPPRELLVVSSIIFAPLKKKKKYEKNTYQHCKKLFPCLEHKRAHLWNDLLRAPIGTESDLALIKKIKQPVHPCRAESYVKTDFGVRHFCFSSSQEKEVILLPWVFPLLWHRLTGT